MNAYPQSRKLLILAANPIGTNRLHLDEEIREIKEGLRRAKRREEFIIDSAEAVRIRDIRRAILDFDPNIVHFSGHGTGEKGLVFEDETDQAKLVDAKALAGLFELFANQVECVVLNACYSQVQAEAINQHIPYVIGMSKAIGDKAAIEFAVGFYDALGADKSPEFAYKLGCNAILMAGIPENMTPLLLRKTQKQLPRSSESENQQEASLKIINSSVLTREKKSKVSVLEYPDGHVSRDSPFYIERPPIEQCCYHELIKPGSLIRIKAPRLMGKTSLMSRILAHAEEQGYQTVYLDLSSVERGMLSKLNKFLRWLCIMVSRQLMLDNQLDNYWNTEDLGTTSNCTAYFEEYLLLQIRSPLVLELDEVDRLFSYNGLAEDFFGMLRSWHEKGKILKIWKQLRLVIAHSTEAYTRLSNDHSPFNVGIPIELPSFTPHQVQDLAQLHGLNWQIDNNYQVTELMAMVGGHPYLVRLALYYLANLGETDCEEALKKVLQDAPTEAGIYRDHLRRLSVIIQENAELVESLKKVMKSIEPVTLQPNQIYKLYSMGLVQRHKHQVISRCNLYREYFRKILL